MHLLLQVLAFCSHLAGIVNQLDHSHFGIVARATSELDDPRITAVAILVSKSELVKQTLYRSDTGRSFDRILGLAFLTAEPARRNFESAVSGVKEPCRLATQVNFPQL